MSMLSFGDFFLKSDTTCAPHYRASRCMCESCDKKWFRSPMFVSPKEHYQANIPSLG